MKNNRRDIKKSDDAELRRRISFTRQSIFGSFLTSTEISTVDFLDVINRLTILIQYPVTFILYKKKNKTYTRLNCDLSFDNNYSTTSHLNEEPDSYPDNTYLYRIFGTSYYLACYSVDFNEKDRKIQFTIIPPIEKKYKKNKNYDIENRSKYIATVLESALSQKYDENFYTKFFDSLSNSISKSIERLEDKCSKTKACDAPPITTIDKLNSEYWRVSGDIFERSYSGRRAAIRLSDDMSNIKALKNDKYLKNTFNYPNIFIYCRSFDRTEDSRLNSYPYNTRILLCDSQKSDFINIFQTLRNKGLRWAKKKFFIIYKDIALKSDYRKIAENANNMFIDILKSNDYQSRLLSIIESDAGKYTRALSDPVFCSLGVIHFRTPFNDSGQSRVKAGTPEQETQSLNDRIRIVIGHYWFEALSPLTRPIENESQRRLSLILIPVHINGAIWGVIGHIFQVNKLEKPYQDADTWDALYYFYNFVFLSIQKELESQLAREYVHKYCQGYINDNGVNIKLRDILVKIAISTNRNEVKNILDSYNNAMKGLTRHYPFERVSLVLLSPNSPANPKKGRFNFVGLTIESQLDDNVFFPGSLNNRNKSIIFDMITKEILLAINWVIDMISMIPEDNNNSH